MIIFTLTILAFINYPGQRKSGSSTDESSQTASIEKKQTYFAGTPVPQPPPYKTNVGQKSSQDNKNEVFSLTCF